MALTSRFPDDAWKAPMEHAMRAVVTINSAIPYSFDHDEKGFSQGTGSVVDTDIGLILTNRHMANEAPMQAQAVFQSGARQCPIEPVFVDPIHDFALCHFDVEHLYGLPLKAIELAPEHATVGREIRILGNDDSQTMSIRPGIIRRIDSNPPRWDSWTSYIQGSADVREGSSGSPVIMKNGSAVAMVSGASFPVSTDLYLPLDLPKRVLEALRRGKALPRGTIQSTWISQKPADCQARGLSYKEIEKYSPDGSGLLVAQEILPDGPSDSYVKEADILLTIDNQIVTSLFCFERLLDGAVGNTLEVQVWRYGNTVKYELQVDNLWTLTSCRLLEYTGAVFQDLRYHKAFYYHIPIRGVTLADAGGSFAIEGREETIILSLNNQPTPDLDAFIAAARKIPDQASVVIEYRMLDSGNLSSRFQRITIDRRWLYQKMILRSRKEDDIASWCIEDLGSAPIAVSQPPQALPTEPGLACYPIVRKIVSNMVVVHARTPYKTNGAYNLYYQCMGLVINANKGFVITARSFMPSTMCTLRIVFADSIEIPAIKVYNHILGFTVLRYNTSLVEGSIGSVAFSPRIPKPQDKMTIYGPNVNGSGPCPKTTTVTSIGPMRGDYECRYFYHPINVDVLHFEKQKFNGAGVLLDKDGDLQGLWLPFFLTRDGITCVGVQLSLLLPVFEKLQEGSLPPQCRILDVELEAVHKNDIQNFGVPGETLKAFPGREFIRAKKVSCSHRNGLEAGDIIIKLEESPVTEMSDLCDMFTHANLRMSVIRRQVKIDLDVPTSTVSSQQSDRVVWFARAQFEPPYSPIPFCTRQLYSRVFVTHISKGSPAQMYGLPLYHFVTQVQGVATVSFDSFIKQIKKIPDGQFCQLTLVNLRGCPITVPLKTNQRNFKTCTAQEKEGSPYGWHFQGL